MVGDATYVNTSVSDMMFNYRRQTASICNVVSLGYNCSNEFLTKSVFIWLDSVFHFASNGSCCLLLFSLILKLLTRTQVLYLSTAKVRTQLQ